MVDNVFFLVRFQTGILGMSKLFDSTGILADLLMLAVCGLASSPAFAADLEKSNIAITIGKMCVGGVATVQRSIEKQTVTPIPEPFVRLSRSFSPT